MEAIAFSRQLGSWPERKGPLHRRLSLGIRDAIRNGLLTPGMRLPSERDLAAALSLSRNTVVAAYNALRDDGWLESRTGGGTWIRKESLAIRDAQSEVRIERIAQSSLLGVLDREGERSIDFATGTPYPLNGFPADALRLTDADYTALQRTRLYYPFGYPPLRQAIAAHYAATGLPTSPEDILITTGAQQAIMLTGSLFLQKGDTALVEDPCYFGAMEAFRALGARVETLPVGRSGIEAPAFRDSINAWKARLVYLTPTFQNPTGTVMPGRTRDEIVRMAAQRGTALVDDRTLAEIELDGAKSATPPPLAAFEKPDKRGTVITIGSLGKLMWAGLRIGWIRAARPLIERLVRVKMANDLGTALPTQTLAVRLFAHYSEAKSLRRVELSRKRDLMASEIRAHLPGWEFTLPRGGLFLWVRLPDGDARELAQVALRHGLVLLPGSTMSAGERHTDVLRIPFLLEEDELREGIRRMIRAWREYSQTSRRRGMLQAIT